jgi:hypothetical protein
MNCQPLPLFAHRRANKSLSHSQLVAKKVSPRRLFTSENNANICNHGSTHWPKGFPVCREISCFPLASCFLLGRPICPNLPLGTPKTPNDGSAQKSTHPQKGLGFSVANVALPFRASQISQSFFLGTPKVPNCQRAGKEIFPFSTSDNITLSEIGLFTPFINILPHHLPP